MTDFSAVYNRFLNKITEDMYLELTMQDTIKDMQNLLINALPGFEFPRKNLFNYEIKTETINKTEVQPQDFILLDENNDLVVVDKSAFAEELTPEEENIIAILMKEAWVLRQVASIENTRMKYSGTDFKLTSQANHLAKLQALLEECRRDSTHMQRLYKRRKINKDGVYESNWSSIMDKSK